MRANKEIKGDEFEKCVRDSIKNLKNTLT